VFRNAAVDRPLTMIYQLYLIDSTFFKRGSTAEIRDFAHRQVEPSQYKEHIELEKDLARDSGDWPEYIRLDREQRYFGDFNNPRWVQDINAAAVFAESGDMAAARTRAAEAMVMMKADLAQEPNNSTLWANLSVANALLGNKDEVLRCAQRSAELMPESRDAIIGVQNSCGCAYAFAWIGEKDRALAEIERLLHVPWGFNIYNLRAYFRVLHDDPRFKALVSDPKNNEPLL